jgi:hypothetical protein
MREEITVSGGRVRLPDTADYAALVDWERVKRYGFTP